MSNNFFSYYKIQHLLISLFRVLVITYILMRIFFFFSWEVSWVSYCLALIFFSAEVFILLHGLSYIRYLDIVAYSEKEMRKTSINPPKLTSYPPVAIVVASYKEPIEVLQDTLICFHNLTYPNKHLYFLDDTRYDLSWGTPEEMEEYKRSVEKLCESTGINLFRRKWHHAKAGMINDFLQFLDGKMNSVFQFIQNSPKLMEEKEKYLIIFDADMNPFPHFVEPLVAEMEKDSQLGFIQTPQYYTNFVSNRVAKAAGLMQVVFYEYICEAKGIKNVVIFCGTNVILRINALKEVGGIDTSTVTEDFATGFQLHTRKWKSSYSDQVCAFGMGPEDLGAFFKQQHRWALGTVSLLPKVIKEFFKHPSRHSFMIWWEYFLASSYYLIGWSYFIFLIGPMFYIYLEFPIYYLPPVVYMMFVIPYNVFFMVLFYFTLNRRGYPIKDIFMGVVLGIISTPVYMMASAQALLGIKGKFVVTPKNKGSSLPLKDLWPQILFGLASFATILWGILRLVYEGAHFWGIVLNVFWLLYFFLIYSSVFFLNQPEEEQANAELQLSMEPERVKGS